jgi:hypothetical protein
MFLFLCTSTVSLLLEPLLETLSQDCQITRRDLLERSLRSETHLRQRCFLVTTSAHGKEGEKQTTNHHQSSFLLVFFRTGRLVATLFSKRILLWFRTAPLLRRSSTR